MGIEPSSKPSETSGPPGNETSDERSLAPLAGQTHLPDSTGGRITTELSPERASASESLLGFFHAEGLDGGLKESDWTLAESIAILVDIARNDRSGSARLSAVKALRGMTADALKLAGVLADAKTTIDELYAWEFDGPHLRDFTGRTPHGKRDAGAIEAAR